MTLKAHVTKEKRQVGLYETKYFVHQKTLSTEQKGNPHNERKMFVNYTSDMGLISRTYIELRKLNKNRTTQIKMSKVLK